MSTQRNALDTMQGVEGMDQKSGQESVSYIVSDPGWQYHGWTVRVGEDMPRQIFYTENRAGIELLRVHYRVSRAPAKRQFVMRHLTGATERDRTEAMAHFRQLPWVFERNERRGAADRVLNRAGRFWVYYMYRGTPVEDPLIQLELEMMIDRGSGVRS